VSPGPADRALEELRARERAAAWIVTGPVGRIAAFLILLGGAFYRTTLGRAGGRG
jgi:hypothetical protein